MAFFSHRILTLLLAASAGLVSAQPANTSESSETAILHFSFRDSARGTMVKPGAILIDNQVKFNAIDEAGRVSIPVTPGDHQVIIKAEGYDDLVSRQTASTEHAPMNMLMLDPVNQPSQLNPENLSKGMPADGTFIVGFVTDEKMGKPIDKATVTLLKKDVTVQTDEQGFFKLPVSIPEGKPLPEDPRGVLYDLRDFQITKPGYGFEERLNVLVETGSPKIYQIQLIRGGGGNSLDESDGRNNLQSSLFGLRNVEPEDAPTTPTAPEDRVKSVEKKHNHDHNHSHPN